MKTGCTETVRVLHVMQTGPGVLNMRSVAQVMLSSSEMEDFGEDVHVA